jgi:adenylate cyclase
MPNIETERKFLVNIDLLPPEAREGGSHYLQGYMLSTPTVRVRVSNANSWNAKAWITIKGGKQGISRAEFEYEIPPEDGLELLKMCSVALVKTRRLVQVGDHTWEVDEFRGSHAGLWLAEIELDSEDEEFVMPAWVTREVTHDPNYTNSALAKSGKVP